MIRYFVRTRDFPEAPDEGRILSVARFDDEGGAVERWDHGRHAFVPDFSILTGLIGLGGETDWRVVSEDEAHEAEASLVERGGPGSGHFGHEGRPGEVGGSQPSGKGVQQVIALEPGAPARIRETLETLRADGNFAEALYGEEGAYIYTDRDAFLVARMRQISESPIELGFAVDSHGYVEFPDWERQKVTLEGTDHSMSIPDQVLWAVRGSDDSVMVHSHPPRPGIRSSPPSAADLELSFFNGVLRQAVATREGYYEFSFTRVPDPTEREEWRQIADLWEQDNPRSDELFTFSLPSQGTGGFASQRRIPDSIRAEVYQRQHDGLAHIASEMPDLFSYRFTPWPTQ